MSEYPRSGKFLNIENGGEPDKDDQEPKKKSGKAKAAVAGIITLLGTKVFTEPVQAADHSPTSSDADKVAERSLSESEMANRNLTFAEFLKMNPQIKASSEQDAQAAFVEHTFENAETVETGDPDEPVVYVRIKKNDYPTSSAESLSSAELTLHEDVQDMIEYVDDAKDMRSDKKAIAAMYNIKDAQRWPNYERTEDFDDGSLARMFEKKNSKKFRIGLTILGAVGMMGDKGRAVANQAGNILFSPGDNIKFETTDSQVNFRTAEAQVSFGEMKGGQPKFGTGSTETLTARYAIKRTTYRVTIQDRFRGGSVTQEVTTFEIILENSALVDSRALGTNKFGKFKANYPNDGRMKDNGANLSIILANNLPVLSDPEQFDQMIGQLLVNNIILEHYDREGAVDKGDVKVAPIPVNAEMEALFDKKDPNGYTLQVPTPINPGREVMFQGPTKQYKGDVVSCTPGLPDKQGRVTYYLATVRLK